MEVDFNNLRVRALETYNELCKTLNLRMSKNKLNPYIQVDVWEIQEEMDQLRMMLYTMACCYIEGREDCKSMADEIGDVATFNPKQTKQP
jgi:hypothetical protein